MPEVISYSPADYDVEELPPELPEAAWQARASVTITKSKEKAGGGGGHPMFRLDWEIESAYDEANEQFVGQTMSDWLVLSPDGGSPMANRMSKLRVRALCDHLGISRTLIPKHIETSLDLQEFADAIDGQLADVWSKHEIQKLEGSNEERTNVRVLYKDPNGGAAGGGVLPPVGDKDDDDAPAGDTAADDDADDGEEIESEEEPEPEAEEPTKPEPAKAAAKNGAKANGTAKANGKPAAAAGKGKKSK